MALAKQAFRTHQQKHQRQHGGTSFDAAADKRAQVDFGQLFARADNQPADNGARQPR